MKETVIYVNSLVLYAVLAVLLVAGFIALGVSDDLLTTGAWIVAGFVAWCLISGLWFVLVAILDELKKLNRKGK